MAASFAGKGAVFAAESADEADPLKGITIIDAHSHPDEFFTVRSGGDSSSSMSSIKQLGMSATAFCAVGDSKQPGGFWEESFPGLMAQLGRAMRYVESGKTKLILKTSDVASHVAPGEPTGCILGIEGANPLQEGLDRFDEVHRMGVRIITLGHYMASAFTDVMGEPPRHGGLSLLGRSAIERMDRLGIIIDAAHASSDSLAQMAEITKRPIIDSHTSPSPGYGRATGRFRGSREMEIIAKTNGIVCTWPMAYRRGDYRRESFLDWAQEILEMKKRIGMEHVGLGTDGGGHLPARIKGYSDVRDLRKLAQAMTEVGLTREDIAAYMGGNFLRVFKAYTG